MRPATAVACVLWLLVASPPARADDGEICLASSIQGQVLRQSGRLLRAREHLAECAKDKCDLAMRERCAAWLKDAEAKTPRLLLTIEDDRGQALPLADVHVDGMLTSAREVELDPGRHVVRADFAGRPRVFGDRRDDGDS